MTINVLEDLKNELITVVGNEKIEAVWKILLNHVSELNTPLTETADNKDNTLNIFLAAKRVEGYSDKSLKYYPLYY